MTHVLVTIDTGTGMILGLHPANERRRYKVTRVKIQRTISQQWFGDGLVPNRQIFPERWSSGTPYGVIMLQWVNQWWRVVNLALLNKKYHESESKMLFAKCQPSYSRPIDLNS